MQINLIRQILPEVFADDLEQSVFLYLMDNFQVSHSQLARYFEVSRTKVYNLLQRWSDLGLITIQRLPKENCVRLGNLQVLQDLITDKQHKLTQLQLQIQNRQTENYYVVQDKQDQIQLFDRILQENSRKEDVRHFGDMDKVVLMLGIDWANYYINKRVKTGIKSRDIVCPSSFLDVSKRWTSEREIREVKYTTADDFDQGYILCNNKIYHLDYRQQAILVYDNSPNYKLLQSTFESNWSNLSLV